MWKSSLSFNGNHLYFLSIISYKSSQNSYQLSMKTFGFPVTIYKIKFCGFEWRLAAQHDSFMTNPPGSEWGLDSIWKCDNNFTKNIFIASAWMLYWSKNKCRKSHKKASLKAREVGKGGTEGQRKEISTHSIEPHRYFLRSTDALLIADKQHWYSLYCLSFSPYPFRIE